MEKLWAWAMLITAIVFGIISFLAIYEDMTLMAVVFGFFSFVLIFNLWQDKFYKHL